MQESLLQANPEDIEMHKQMGETTFQIADSYYALGNYEEVPEILSSFTIRV
ncbi:MAG: hypothetical protein WKF84_23810 [Pyrinomonadaceae bacterium]